MFQKVIRTTRTWKQRRNDRASLATMEPRILRDMGLNQMQAMREARKPFWRR